MKPHPDLPFHLGKADPTPDPRDALFTEFATVAKLPKAPATYDPPHLEAEWGMLGNGPDDSVAPGFQGAGDCVFAGGDHETMLWQAEGGGKAASFTGATAISDYAAVTGYVVGDDSTDRGTVVRDALLYRRRTGLVDAGGARHKLGAFVQLEPGNTDHVKLGTYLLGVAGIGFQFPSSAMRQFDRGKPWTVVAGAQVEGGHYVPVIGYSAAGVLVVSWGRVQLMTWPFFRKYVDEAWGLLSPEFLRAGRSPQGFDLKGLKTYLSALKV